MKKIIKKKKGFSFIEIISSPVAWIIIGGVILVGLTISVAIFKDFFEVYSWLNS